MNKFNKEVRNETKQERSAEDIALIVCFVIAIIHGIAVLCFESEGFF